MLGTFAEHAGRPSCTGIAMAGAHTSPQRARPLCGCRANQHHAASGKQRVSQATPTQPDTGPRAPAKGGVVHAP